MEETLFSKEPYVFQWEEDRKEFGGETIDIPEEIGKMYVKERKDSSMDISEEEKSADDTGLPPWMTPRTQVDDPWVQLHNEIVEFYRIYGPSKEQNSIRKELFIKIKKTIKSFFPGCIVKMFGSTAAMLYLPKSDIDVVVFLPKKSTNDFSNAKKLYKSINKMPWVKSCECIGAKVPIVKLEDSETGLCVDVSFSRANGVSAISFIKKYLILYPEIKYMLIIVKAFLKGRDLNETFHGGMSSFVCTLLIISYFQESRKDGQNEDLLLSEHLLNFFYLYGVRFNYNELGISIRNGGTYFLREERGWLAQNRNKSVTLWVENPQDISVDLGKGVYNMPQVHAAFQHAYDILRFNSYNTKSLLQCIMGDISNLR